MTRRRRRKPTFENSVFINCPFDDEYAAMFRAMVFTIEACDFIPRCALEVDDAGETRSEKLIRLIRTSRLGIHDISRTEVNAEQLPRFNMPYEFGMFMGFRHSGSVRQKQKAVLVLDREPYRYQRFLSDIAGQDIRSHGGSPDELIRQVRHWLQSQVNRDLFGATRLVADYSKFVSDISGLVGKLDKSEQDLTNFRDFHRLVGDWVDVTYYRPTSAD
jgi:hypothetical protein